MLSTNCYIRKRETLRRGPGIKQYLSSISISQGNSNEVTITNIIFTTEYLTGRLWAQASVISVSFTKVSFFWRTPFPLALYNYKLIHFSSHFSDYHSTRNSNYRRKNSNRNAMRNTCRVSRSVFLKVGGRAPLGAILRVKWAKKTKGDRGAKQHKGSENAQALIDYWVYFSNLILWLVSFLQILIYYANRWRLLLKQFICLIFTLDRLCVRLQCGLFQGCGAVVKMTQLRLRNYSFHEHVSGSSSWALGFHECGSGSGALFFHGSGSRSGFWSFSHNILIVLGCLKLNGKWIISSTQN